MNLGAIEDYRTDEAKAKDYKFSEIVASVNPVVWTEKKPSEWRKFLVRNQDGSGSCVAQSIAKLAEISYFLKTGQKIPFSAAYYKLRTNAPSEGMIGTDAFDIWRKQGVPLEELCPSQNLSEKSINNQEITAIAKDTGEVFKIDNYVLYSPATDFEKIASTIQTTGKGVMVWFKFNYNEWTDVPEVKGNNPTLHHSVVAVDFTLYKGKKALIIDESWGDTYGLNGQRVITEDFFKARNTFAAYPLNFKFFTTTLPKFDGSIKSLQDCLKYEGFFPANVESTGFFGSITKAAISKWQDKHGLPSQGIFGDMSKKLLHTLYP
jgi:hypothetical protein